MVLTVACALALASCTIDERLSLSAAQPRGATVAFESIDGMPAGQFAALVRSLNDEAQNRHLAVVSRESPSAYRVRGNLAAKVVKGRTTIAWTWDVLDGNEQSALRINGEETVNGRHRDAWSVADDAMLKRIAHTSMEQLAAFLTSPAVTPNTPIAAVDPSTAAGERSSSPEAAGIFRIFRPQADPVSAVDAQSPAVTDDKVGEMPRPRSRPKPAAVMSARESLLLAAAPP